MKPRQPPARAGAKAARPVATSASKVARPAANMTRTGGGVVDDIATLRKAKAQGAVSPGKVQVDAKGFAQRPNAVEDAFVQQYRANRPVTQLSDDAIRAEFREGKRFTSTGKLEKLDNNAALASRKTENAQLRSSSQFESDVKARGISEERIKWMDEKKCPLSFDSPKQYEEFQKDLRKTLDRVGLDDSVVSMKGTSTTFYSENPGKPLGHHFDANANEIADIDLGLSSSTLVDEMQHAGKSAHPKISSIFKTRDTTEVFPELQAFAERWERTLGRPVNFVGLTDRAKPAMDATDFLVSGALK